MKRMILKSVFAIVLGLFLVSLNKANARDDDINLTYNISSNNIYSPGEKIAINLYSYSYDERSKNLRSIPFRFTIYKIKDVNGFYSKQSSRYNIDVFGSDSTNLTFLTDEIDSFTKKIKVENDYGYFYVNESVNVNITEKGAYLVKATNGKQVAYCGFIISSLGVISKAGNNSMLAYVVDRKSGDPITGADLNFFVGNKQIGKGNTQDGLFYQVVNPDVYEGMDNTSPFIVGKFGDDIVISDAYLYFGYGANRFYTYVFTNQPVYRTESLVEFKGTIRKNSTANYEVYANKNVTVTIKDSRYAEVYKEVLTTNDMGSFNGQFQIDKEAPLGTYWIYVNIDESNSSSASFEVEQFKKPEYKVTVNTDKGQYYGEDLMKGTVEAKYYFGSPVDGAEVEYNVYKKRYYRPWWMFSEYAWWYEDYYASLDPNSQYSGAEMIYSGTGTLNSEGKFDFEYAIKEDFKQEEDGDYWWRWWYPQSNDFQYIVQARVVDKSRREISGTTTAFVTRGGFSLASNADKYWYKSGDEVNLKVIATNFENKPVVTDFEAAIYKNRWSYYDNKNSKDYITTVSGKTMSDGVGYARFKLDNPDPNGYYTAEIKSKDERGNVIETSTYFYCSDGDFSWYYNQSGGIQIITDKDSYMKGEVCKAFIIIPTPNAHVLTATQTDNILYYKAEKFTGTSAMIDIPITEDYTSNFDISVSYVADGVFYSESKPVIVMQEDKFLTVEIDPSQEIYKPKETGELKVRVVDDNGNPVRNAEVSLGIIDESIYDIQPDLTKDIRKFFYGPRFTSVSTTFNSYNQNYGYSRLLSIYERFNIRSLKDSDLGTIKGRLLGPDDTPIAEATIVVDNDYLAGFTDNEGNFEFKLPEGDYEIGVLHSQVDEDNKVNISVKRGATKTVTLRVNAESFGELTLGDDREETMLDGNSGLITSEVTQDQIEINRPEMKKESEKLANTRGTKTGDEDSKDKSLAPVDVRSDFRDAIYWSPYQMTDADGYATVYIDYPDNLTTWRITSRVITADTKVGQNTKTVITRKDLLVRMETPRFLQQDDEVTISTIIHNYLSSDKSTKVKFTAENVELLDGGERTIELASNTDQRLDWKIKVTQPIGEAVLYAEALTDEESDAVQIKIPLQPKGLKVTESTIADFEDNSKIELKNVYIPESVDIRSAGMKFSLSPSLAGTILNALDELAGYPYGCVEQTMSRFLPTVVVANTYKELNAPISAATKDELPKMVDAGLKRLYGFQHYDGGWGWWQNDQSNPFMTAYVIYGLSLAKSAGYQIKASALSNGIIAMKNSLREDLDPTTRAYILYSLAVAEERDSKLFEEQIDKVLADREVNNYARALVAMTLQMIGDKERALTVVGDLENNVTVSGEGAAYWEGKSFHYNWQDDKVQTTAMGLKALVNVKGDSDLKNKIIRWLMNQRFGLAWRNTQETAFIIYAMVDYLKNSNELTPNYKVSVYVNNELYMEKQMTTEDIFKKDELIEIPNDKLRTGNNEIRIEKEGAGKVYFSANTSFYQSDYIVKARENGFRVEREYYKLEKYESYTDNKITYRKKYFDGTAVSGDVFLVKVRVYSKENENMNYFMLEDPIPAGCEVVKDDWAYQIEEEPNYTGYDYYWWRWWYADKDIRDNRVTFFATYLYGNSYEFSYIVRAQIPGTYTVNPAQGMLMYYTDVNGSSQDMVMRIYDK